METNVFDIVREAITLAKVRRIQTVVQLKTKLFEFGHSIDDVQAALEFIRSRHQPFLNRNYQ